MASRLSVPGSGGTHPKKCDQARNKWSSYAFDGKISIKNLKEAASLWEQGLKVAPGNEKAIININRLNMLDKLNDKNLSAAQQMETFNNIGFLYWGNKEFEIAEMYFKKLLELDPRQPMVLANLGAACFDSGKYKEAINVLEQVLVMKPDFQFREQVSTRLKWLHSIVDKPVK